MLTQQAATFAILSDRSFGTILSEQPTGRLSQANVDPRYPENTCPLPDIDMAYRWALIMASEFSNAETNPAMLHEVTTFLATQALKELRKEGQWQHANSSGHVIIPQERVIYGEEPMQAVTEEVLFGAGDAVIDTREFFNRPVQLASLRTNFGHFVAHELIIPHDLIRPGVQAVQLSALDQQHNTIQVALNLFIEANNISTLW